MPALNRLLINPLCLKPLVLLHTVDRNEWQKDRGLLYICLILRVSSIGSVLTDFESACSAEHHIYDADVSNRCNDPLPYCTTCSKAYDERSGPDDKFAEIVRTAHFQGQRRLPSCRLQPMPILRSQELQLFCLQGKMLQG